MRTQRRLLPLLTVVIAWSTVICSTALGICQENTQLTDLPAGDYIGSTHDVSQGGGHFIFQQYTNGSQWSLFVVPTDGSAPPVDVGEDFLPQHRLDADWGNVPGWVTASDDYVVYEQVHTNWAIWNETEDILWSKPTDGGPGFQLNSALATNPTQHGSIWYQTCRGTNQVLYVAEHDDGTGLSHLYAVQPDGSAPPVRLSTDTAESVYQQRFTVGTSAVPKVVYQTNAGYYSVPADGSQTPVEIITYGFVGGYIAYDNQLSPNEEYFVFRGGRTEPSDTIVDLYSVRTDGSAPPVNLSGTLVAGGSVMTMDHGTPFAISPDSQWVIFEADKDTDDVYELYSVPIDGSAAAVKLNGALPPGGDVIARKYDMLHKISRDSMWVAYVAEQDQLGIPELYGVPIDGSAPAVRLHDAFAGPTGISTNWAKSLEVGLDHQVVYRADHDGNGEWDWWTVPMDGSAPPVLVNDPPWPGQGIEGPAREVSPDGTMFYYNGKDAAEDEVYWHIVPFDRSAPPSVLSPPAQIWLLPDSSGFVFKARDEFDPDNNAYTATLGGSPDLVVTKTSTPNPIPVSDSLVYTIVISNAGNCDASGVVVTDTLPAEVTFVSAPGCVHDSGEVTCNVGTLGEGGWTTITVTVTAPAEWGWITNNVSVTHDQADATPDDNTVAATTTVQLLNVPVLNPNNGHYYELRHAWPVGFWQAEGLCEASTANGWAGHLVTITSQEEMDWILATWPTDGYPPWPPPGDGENGPNTFPLLNHWIGAFQCPDQDAPDEGWQWVKGEPWGFTYWNSSEPNDYAGVSSGIEDNEENFGALVPQAQWYDYGDINMWGYLVEYEPPRDQADLSVVKVADVDEVQGEEEITYTITVRNDGPDDAIGVVVSDVLPPGSILVSASPPGYTLTMDGIEFNTSLANGVEQVFTVTVTAPDTTQPLVITNQATIAADQLDPVPCNNSSAVETSVLATGEDTDLDGDGIADVIAYEPFTGNWYIHGSAGTTIVQNWGYHLTVPVVGDYDGDGQTDIGCFEPSTGNWYIKESSTGQVRMENWGFSLTLPVPCDYDGDGLTDISVYHKYLGDWFIKQSATDTLRLQDWGYEKTIPVPGDYDGDGTCDIAVFEVTTGYWYMNGSTAGYMLRQWGYADAVPAPCDYDGDGITDIAVYIPDTGFWYISESSTGATRTKHWGYALTVPVPADYDGDGECDLCSYESITGDWFILESTTGNTRTLNWGYHGTEPVEMQYWLNKHWFVYP